MIIQNPTDLPDAPADAPRVLSKAEAGFLDEVNERLVQLLDPSTETHVPILLSGCRESGLSDFLDDGLKKLHERRRITDLVVFTPGHANGALHAQAEAFVALYPSLAETNMEELPPSFWSSLVKAEMGKQSPKRTRRVIVLDKMEELFEDSVAPGDRTAFLKNLIDIAQSFCTSVVFVVDHALIAQCQELHELKTSLGSRFHIRVPVIGQPASAPAAGTTDWSRFSSAKKEEKTETEPEPKPALEIARRSEPEPETELVPIPEVVAEPKKSPAPTKAFTPAANLESNESDGEETPYYSDDPVPLPSSVVVEPDKFWRQMTWVWMAGYGVALVMIVGLVILGTSAPDPTETAENPAEIAISAAAEPTKIENPYVAYESPDSTPTAVAPDKPLTPVSASAAVEPAHPIPPSALDEAILRFEVSDSNLMLPDRLSAAFTGEARPWLVAARRTGPCLAAELGLLYSRSDLKTRDAAKALHWFEFAASQGCAEGGFFAAQALFFESTGVGRDPIRAVDHFLASAQSGHSQSAYMMGVCRLLGDGVLRNYQIAEEWFERSIELGGIEAYQELAMMRERGIGGPVDRPAAAGLYRKGAEAGNRFCMEKCASLLAEAKGDESERSAGAEIWRQRARETEINELQRRVRALAPGLYQNQNFEPKNRP